MTKGFKAVLSVIASHAAFAYSVEAKTLAHHVHNGIIDATAAERELFEHSGLCFFAARKEIQRQRLSRLSINSSASSSVLYGITGSSGPNISSP